MAEDDRAVAEGSASWSLQGGMGLHLRGRGLQLSPYEESADASNLSRGRSVLAGPKMNPRDTSGCSQNPSPITKSRRLEESKSRRPFFRSLLEPFWTEVMHRPPQRLKPRLILLYLRRGSKPRPFKTEAPIEFLSSLL